MRVQPDGDVIRGSAAHGAVRDFNECTHERATHARETVRSSLGLCGISTPQRTRSIWRVVAAALVCVGFQQVGGRETYAEPARVGGHRACCGISTGTAASVASIERLVSVVHRGAVGFQPRNQRHADVQRAGVGGPSGLPRDFNSVAPVTNSMAFAWDFNATLGSQVYARFGVGGPSGPPWDFKKVVVTKLGAVHRGRRGILTPHTARARWSKTAIGGSSEPMWDFNFRRASSYHERCDGRWSVGPPRDFND
jgi:hypothetical protein